MSDKTVLVVGSTGKTGRRVAARLTGRGVNLRHGGRAASPPFDWTNRATWPAALYGVDAAYVTYYPDLAIDGAAADIKAFTDIAAASGVRHLVLLSGRGEPEAQRCEEIVRRCGLDWTLIRATWFSQNFDENYLLEPIVAGEVVLPADGVGAAFIDADDIADVAVAALTGDGHTGQLYELTGTRAWTFPEAIAEIARATGRNITYRYIPVEEYAAILRTAEVPPEFVDLLVYLFSEVLVEANATIADGVTRALGRPPREFADYVRETAATGVWAPQ